MWRTELAKYQVFNFSSGTNIFSGILNKARFDNFFLENNHLVSKKGDYQWSNVFINSTIHWVIWTFQCNLNELMAWKGKKICGAMFTVWIEENEWKAGEAEFSLEIFLMLHCKLHAFCKWKEARVNLFKRSPFSFQFWLQSWVLPVQIGFVRLYM